MTHLHRAMASAIEPCHTGCIGYITLSNQRRSIDHGHPAAHRPSRADPRRQRVQRGSGEPVPARPPGCRRRYAHRLCRGSGDHRGQSCRGRLPDRPGRAPATARVAAAAGDAGPLYRCPGRRGLLFRRPGPRWQPGRHAGVDRLVPGRPCRRRGRARLLPGPQQACLARAGLHHRILRRTARYPPLLVLVHGRSRRPCSDPGRSALVHGSDSRIPSRRLPCAADSRDAIGMAGPSQGAQGASGRAGRPCGGGQGRGGTGPPDRRLSRPHQTTSAKDLRAQGATGNGVGRPGAPVG
jgi:hypothetical protein